MFKFFKKKNNKNENISHLILKTAALLIHAAKIDENYSNLERKIIKDTVLILDPEIKDVEKFIADAEDQEKNSNQILDFTKEIKNADETFKIKIIESLWKIIYSNEEADMYESNLMRRLSGLLYLDNKLVGEIKQKVKENLIK